LNLDGAEAHVVRESVGPGRNVDLIQLGRFWSPELKALWVEGNGGAAIRIGDSVGVYFELGNADMDTGSGSGVVDVDIAFDLQEVKFCPLD